MIGRRITQKDEEVVERKAFDDFELRLGDVMRGERATLGKSLLDVQRELRIKASYIAAIENCDPDAFDTPGFIAGYVRSYARYLGMNPDVAFADFCTESGFSVAHGMSAEASVIKKPSREDRLKRGADNDIFNRPSTPFIPTGDAFWTRIEPGAVGSSLVLIALISAIGYGGYSVLREVQRVQVTPVEQTPIVLSDLDPLEGALGTSADTSVDLAETTTIDQPRAEALDRLYRPQALDVPVLVARDAPIATLDPRVLGNFASQQLEETQAGEVDRALNMAMADIALEPVAVPQVSEAPVAGLRMVAVRPSWVRVSAADGSVIFEKIMEPGDVWVAPTTEEPPTLRTGESGAIYFAMDGQYYGPVGSRGEVTSNLPLASETLKTRYAIADLAADEGLATVVVELQSPPVQPTPVQETE